MTPRMGDACFAEPIWFGPQERPLHGWLHRPDKGDVRGGVVICPPVGIDLSHAYTNLLLLARALADAGFLVVRFDYDGTGQSAGGMDDSDRLGSWIESIRAAAHIAREAGVTWLGGVGLRLGATLLARAAAMDGAFSSLALWDPYSSGTAFLREQSAVKLGVLPQLSESVPGLAAAGYVFSPETVEELQALEIGSADELRAEHVLVLTDPARRTDKPLKQKLGEEPPVEWQEYCQVSDLYDTGRLDYVTPRAVVEQVATWVAGSCTEESRPLLQPIARNASVVVAISDEGVPTVEKHRELGPVGLFGIETVAGETSADRPTVLLLTIAGECSIGPARQWVDYSRRLAAQGFRSIRFDLSSIADSPTRPGQPERALYAPEAVEDIADAARAASPTDPSNVVLVGVCSGAYAALAAVPRIRPRAVVAVNPLMTEWGEENAFQAAASEAAPRITPTSLGAAIRGRLRRSSLKGKIVDRLPPLLWRVVFALNLAHSPVRLLAPVWKAKVPTLLVCGEEEARLPKARSPQALGRLGADHISRFEELPTLNHSLLHAENRATIYSMLFAFIQAVAATESPEIAGPQATENPARAPSRVKRFPSVGRVRRAS